MGAEFIAPIIENALAVLKQRTPGLLAGRDLFVNFGKQFTGVVSNFPSLYVMPVGTAFDADAQHLVHQAHQVQVKLAVSGAEPDLVTEAALAYMRAVDLAIAQSWPKDWEGKLQNGVVLRVFVERHDYGPLFERQGALARFPELDLIVETEEMP